MNIDRSPVVQLSGVEEQFVVPILERDAAFQCGSKTNGHLVIKSLIRYTLVDNELSRYLEKRSFTIE